MRQSFIILGLLGAAALASCDKKEPAAPAPSAAGKLQEVEAPRLVILTDANFKSEVLDSSKPVLVDIWATWCGPCKRAAPTIDAIAAEYSGRVKVGKLDSDANQQTASQYVKQGIPLFLVFKGGKVVHESVGFANDAHLKGVLRNALNAALK